ncbi:nuclear transport factor 2 family protein [Sphingobium lactosutens]|uniref:SnoaL-like domain-containing protein n=1 Tax=Sphingobium lactosutens DS20 TaxID=1331060 RepID=T0HKW5_9SPHN|nr:nuclear transport factor 2 family protein [Sphingobium lactosutens]EQB16996.1 hypothetical protein RLDS_06065 [Sphingobium lactosutens DS20]
MDGLSVELLQLPARFFSAIDSGEYNHAAQYMGQNGIWHRQGKQLEGVAGVLEALRDRAADRHTAHVVTNIVADPNENGGSVSFLLTAYEYVGDATAPYPLDRAKGIGRYVANCCVENGMLKIAELSSRIIFKAP